MVKRAFSLIELVFSIVIISISMLTIPFLMTEANKSDEEAIKQQAIFHSIALMNIILSFPWDDENKNENVNKILTVINSTCQNMLNSDINATLGERSIFENVAGIGESLFRTCTVAQAVNNPTPPNLSPIPILIPTAPKTSISSFNGYGEELNGYDINVTVKYIKDDYTDSNKTNWYENSSVSTNLKQISIKSYDCKKELIAELNYVAGNIGVVEIRKVQ